MSSVIYGATVPAARCIAYPYRDDLVCGEIDDGAAAEGDRPPSERIITMKFKTAEAETAPMTFRCKADLRAAIEWAAANEGISSSDVIRRAVMFDVRRRKAEVADVGAGGEKGF